MAIQFAEGQVTKLRREFKLLLTAAQSANLCGRLADEVGAEPTLVTTITSVYFDRPGFPLASRAIETPDDCLKVRTKEYEPDLGGPRQQRVVLEVKRERNGLTQKRRLWVPRARLSRVVSGARGLLHLIGHGALLPVLVVTYTRQVYQRTEAWRVTVDRDVTFFRPDPDLLTRTSRGALGEPCAREERVVVEVKHLGEELPVWLGELALEGSRRFSKFAEGMARLHALGVRGGVNGG